MEIQAFGHIEKGALTIARRDKLDSDLSLLGDCPVEILIRKRKRFRSTNQNRFYHGVVIPSIKYAMESKGFLINSNEQIHELLKFKFLKGEILNVPTGELIETIGSTTKLSTMDFEDYLTKIRAWASQYLECIIPEPNEQLTFSE